MLLKASTAEQVFVACVSAGWARSLVLWLVLTKRNKGSWHNLKKKKRKEKKTSPRPASARVSWCLETSSIKTPFPGRVSVPSSFVSLFIFYILSYLLLKTMGCFSGLLMSSASDQKLFCEVCSAFNCSFDEFVGEKVVSTSYPSAILAPPLYLNLILRFIFSVAYIFTILFLFYVFGFWAVGHVGSLLPNQGSDLHPLHWKVKS